MRWSRIHGGGGIILLKSKIFGRKKIKVLNGIDKNRLSMPEGESYNIKELYNSIINISNISCQHRNTD